MKYDARFNLRLPEYLHTAIKSRAMKHSRTVTSEMVVLFKLGLVNEENEGTALTAADKLISQAKREKRKTK